MPTFLRWLATLLLGALVVLAVLGWTWSTAGGSPHPLGARVALGLSGIAAVVGIVGVWRVGRGDPS